MPDSAVEAKAIPYPFQVKDGHQYVCDRSALIQPEAFIDESMAKDWLDFAANTLRPAKDGSMDFVDGKVVRIDRAHPALAAIDLHAIPQRDWVRQFD